MTADKQTNARPTFPQRVQAWILTHACPVYERSVAPYKRALLGNLSGTVLEIGPGAGVNLEYYPAGIRWIGVEPNPILQHHLHAAIVTRKLDAELHGGTAERLEQDDASVDAVVSTLVLCTVRDLDGTLREIRRVLRPGGRFVFIEHVAAPAGTWTRRAQQFVKPVWRYFGDGCQPDRETWRRIEAAGFADVKLEHFRVPSPIVGPHIRGFAIR